MKRYFTGVAVSVLGHHTDGARLVNLFGLFGFGLLIISLTVKEKDNIRILLDGTGISQVGKHRLVTCTGFCGTVEL